MTEKPRNNINLVTTQRRLPILESAARETEGKFTSTIVPARGKIPEIVVFQYTGDIDTLRRKILIQDLKVKNAQNPNT